MIFKNKTEEGSAPRQHRISLTRYLYSCLKNIKESVSKYEYRYNKKNFSIGTETGIENKTVA